MERRDWGFGKGDVGIELACLSGGVLLWIHGAFGWVFGRVKAFGKGT